MKDNDSVYTRGCVNDNHDGMRSTMLERLATVAAKGGFEMEKNVQTLFCGRNLRSCSFLWTGDRDHQIYKDKVAAYTNSPPPPTPPSAQYTLGLVDRCVSKASLAEQLALCKDVSSFSLPIPQGMLRKQFGIIKFTAQFVVRYGFEFGMALTDRVSTDTRFQFLLATETRFMSLDKRDTCDVMYHFFCKLLVGYGCLIKEWENPPAGLEAVLQGFLTVFDAFRRKQDHEEEDELVDKEKTDWRDFVVYDEYFVDIENRESPRPPSPTSTPYPSLNNRFADLPGFGSRLMNPFRFTIGTPETRKEIGLMMFTAQFVVRYGNYFWEVLWDLVGPNSEFHFLDRNHENKLFAQILRAYGCVIQPWSIRPRKSDLDRVQDVLHGFSPALADWKEKQEEGAELVEKLEVDRRDFVVGDERFRYFLAMEECIRRPEKLVIPQSQFARPPPVHDKPEPSRWKQPPPLLEEPEPKRGKPDESALV